MRRLLVLLPLVALMFTTASTAQATSAVRQDGPVWNSAMVWQPTLPDAGLALADLVNQIDATCHVDVDPVVTTAGSGPEGAVYAFAVTWGCPAGAAEVPTSVWNSALIWQPTLADAGDALAAHLNEIDATCAVDVDTIVAANGTGPEGPVYAFLVTWAC
jgi:hypothetical protein